MKENKLRQILNRNGTSVSTRLWSTWPVYTEVVGTSGNFDYMEFVAEYAPFSQMDLENMARAAELYHMGSMIKVDFQNRAYVAQKAAASGFQAINFADHSTPQEVEESIQVMRPYVTGTGGRYGCPNRRFIGRPEGVTQREHIQRLKDIVLCFMIEKQEAVERIEEICSVPGIDMVQFGPADYCMSRGWDRKDHEKEYKEAERTVIRTALAHGIQPRCEIGSPEEARYYMDLGVRHFSLGDQMAVLKTFWNREGSRMRELAGSLERP